jgi:hypothetical protein
MIELLPPRVRDHWPDRYIAACSPQNAAALPDAATVKGSKDV